jgi:hypothetical protein
MANKKDEEPKRTTQLQSTTSSGSASAQVVGDGNTVNIQQQGDRGGRVVPVYMPHGSRLLSLKGVSFSPRPGGLEVVAIEAKRGDTVQPEALFVKLSDDGYFPWYLPSPVAGVIESIHVAVGDQVKEGYLIATVRVWEPK